MNRYGLFTKTGYELIIMTHQDNIEQAKKYFAGLKQLSKEKLNEIFLVAEIKDNETIKQSITSRSNKIKHGNS
jgi:hypothetical protein